MHLKYLITGGSGFIGTALVKSLIDKYKSTVVNIDKSQTAINNNLQIQHFPEYQDCNC